MNALKSSTALEVPDYDVSLRVQAADGLGRNRTPAASTSNTPETFRPLLCLRALLLPHDPKPGNHKFSTALLHHGDTENMEVHGDPPIADWYNPSLW